MQQDPSPEVLEGGVARAKEPVLLIDQAVLNAAVTTVTSRSIIVRPYRHFALFVRIKSASTPTDVRFIVEFLEKVGGRWHTYQQAQFASLYYEDQDTATEVDEVFSGDCAGRELRVRVVATGTTASATFTVSAAVDLYS